MIRTTGTTGRHIEPRQSPCPALLSAKVAHEFFAVPLGKHWESTSAIGCSVCVVNHDWLQLQLHSMMAEVLMQIVTQVVFLNPRNIKVALRLILIVTIHGQE